MDPLVTVIIPTRNRWSLLWRTLHGALNQEDVAIEVIVVDDASTDGTELRLAGIKDNRLRVLRNPECLGVSASRNRAVAEARGTWLAFLDDDDLWAPWKLQELIDCVARTEGARWACSAALVVTQTTDILQYSPAPEPETMASELLMRNAVPGGCSNVIAELSLVREVGGFDTELTLLADWDLWIRLALTAAAAVSQEALIAYVRHPQSMVSGGQQDVAREVDLLVSKYRDQAAAYGVRPDLRALYRYFARAHRRAGRRVPASHLYARIAVGSRSVGDAFRAVAVLFGERVLTAGAWTKGARPGTCPSDDPSPPRLARRLPSDRSGQDSEQRSGHRPVAGDPLR